MTPEALDRLADLAEPELAAGPRRPPGRARGALGPSALLACRRRWRRPPAAARPRLSASPWSQPEILAAPLAAARDAAGSASSPNLRRGRGGYVRAYGQSVPSPRPAAVDRHACRP